MTKERRLGRGLEALLGRAPAQGDTPLPTQELSRTLAERPPQGATVGPDGASLGPSGPPVNPPGDAAPAGSAATKDPARIDIRQIDSNPFQPRQDFNPSEMQALAESLMAHGLLQPVVVRRAGDRYQVIAGERRLRAAQQAGWTEVPANVVQADEREMAEMAIVENLQRKDLNPLEKAASFQRYLERYGVTQEELASRLKLDRSTIANLIRLLELPETVQEAIRQGKITQGHARALLPLGEVHQQIEFCGRIQREGLSVRQTESLVQETVEAHDAEPLGVIDHAGKQQRAGRVQSPHLAALEQELRAALGTKVKITHNARGRGKLVIHFRSHEEFERLRQQLTDPGRPQSRLQAG